MLDFTKNISVPQNLKRFYLIGRSIIFVAFATFVVFAAYRLIFPPSVRNYSASPLRMNKNTLNTPVQVKTEEGETLSFDTAEIGNFSNISVKITRDKKSPALDEKTLSLRKSYRTYFYPTDSSLGFNNGTLLVSPQKEYYIVSDNTLRMISSDVLQKLGWNKDAFLRVESADLAFTMQGDPVSANFYPQHTLFFIDGNYYQLLKDKLHMFITERAFLSLYNPAAAIEKPKEFLTQYAVAEEFLGYADGTLLSNPQSVFIVSEGKSYPIDNPITVTALGYKWEDVISAADDEIGMYEKQKVFSQDQPHPNGTILKEKVSGRLFLVRNGKKHELPSEAIAKSYIKNTPILVDEASLTTTAQCVLSKRILPLRRYACQIPIENLDQFMGNDYLFAIEGKNIELDAINLTFTKKLIFANVQETWTHIKYQLNQSYVRQ